MKVAVIGASTADELSTAIAEKVGRLIAERGWHLLCGGGGGVMEAACRGFCAVPADVRGMTVGILPSDTAEFANYFVELTLPTGLGFARNAMIVQAADGIIAVGGCAGTLSELAYAWQFEKPVAAMSASGGWSARLAGERLDERFPSPIFAATSAEAAAEYLTSVFVKTAR